jgi:gamma-glutamyl:cysteine ligase YbdK (ATP-grasp superfamily)
MFDTTNTHGTPGSRKGDIVQLYLRLTVGTRALSAQEASLKRGVNDTYKSLEVLGPEHEFSVVNDDLKALPIMDRVIKDYCGRTMNFVEEKTFTFGKELQLHVTEVKANEPFRSPELFEATMQNAVAVLSGFLWKKYRAYLLGTGMHPLLKLNETGIWPHRHRKIYREYSKAFNLNQHGWLNIQSYHLNLPYSSENDGVSIHNLLAIICAYLPAISASSPIFEGKIGTDVDNRLRFYKENQREVPSVAGDVVPDAIKSFSQYKEEVIAAYSRDLAASGVGQPLLYREWVNSRGVIFRFDRAALEVRVMDEQECVKSDVALSCFIRAALRGLIAKQTEPSPHDELVNDFNAIVARGLNAEVFCPERGTARRTCKSLLKTAQENADEDEKKYLWIVEKRIAEGNLSELIRGRISRKAQRTDLEEAIRKEYSILIKCLANNQPYF